jgi:hypothetical protein
MDHAVIGQSRSINTLLHVSIYLYLYLHLYLYLCMSSVCKISWLSQSSLYRQVGLGERAKHPCGRGGLFFIAARQRASAPARQRSHSFRSSLLSFPPPIKSNQSSKKQSIKKCLECPSAGQSETKQIQKEVATQASTFASYSRCRQRA